MMATMSGIIIEKINNTAEGGLRLILRAKAGGPWGPDTTIGVVVPENVNLALGDKLIIHVPVEDTGTPTIKTTRLVQVSPSTWVATTAI